MTKHPIAFAALLLVVGCNEAPSAPPAPASSTAPAAPAGAPAAAGPQTAPGPDFLARNGAVRGVTTTPSGLQYYIVRSGAKTGVSPKLGDNVVFDYEGKLTTGETFDSSYERGEPLSGGVSDFVPGFTEALLLMRPGDDWIVWLPPQLGYGDRASGTIPANSVLRFRMALRSVAPAQ